MTWHEWCASLALIDTMRLWCPVKLINACQMNHKVKLTFLLRIRISNSVMMVGESNVWLIFLKCPNSTALIVKKLMRRYTMITSWECKWMEHHLDAKTQIIQTATQHKCFICFAALRRQRAVPSISGGGGGSGVYRASLPWGVCDVWIRPGVLGRGACRSTQVCLGEAHVSLRSCKGEKSKRDYTTYTSSSSSYCVLLFLTTQCLL